jgi:serine/threonine-protein kinase
MAAMVDESTLQSSLDEARTFAHYQVGRVVGLGKWGVVFEAIDTRSDEWVALKLLHSHLEVDAVYLERFRREAELASRLQSPHAVAVLDFGVQDGHHFLVMPFADGESLSAVLRSGPLGPAEALRIASEVASALEEAAALGVVHRDIKPANVMIAPDGAARVLDFGIARQAGRDTLTLTGAFIGTPAYVAPEAAGGRAEHRSDLYSLGVMLFQMLTGSLPFEGPVIELLRQHASTPARRSRARGLRDWRPRLPARSSA